MGNCFGKSKKPGEKVNILCYGDSLTAGYSGFGSEFTPYGDTLASKGNGVLDVTAVGMSGWTTKQMIDNLDSAKSHDVCFREGKGLRHLVTKGNFDMVIIMAGSLSL